MFYGAQAMVAPDISTYLLLPLRSLRDACMDVVGCRGNEQRCAECRLAVPCLAAQAGAEILAAAPGDAAAEPLLLELASTC